MSLGGYRSTYMSPHVESLQANPCVPIQWHAIRLDTIMRRQVSSAAT